MAPDTTPTGFYRKDSVMNIVDTGSSHSRRVHRNSQGGLDVNVLGVFTGSGLDEFNCVLVRYHQDAPNAPLRAHILQHGKVPIPSRNRIPLLTIFHDVQRQISAISEFNTQLGQEFSRGVKTFCKDHDITLDSIDLIGTHSSNVAPRRRSPDMSAFHSFGWNCTITAETGVTTIFDSAVADSSTRPTPPVAFVEKLFLRHPSKFRVCLQISELANFTFIPCLADGDLNGTISHNCGPGSLLIDYAMRYCTSNNHREDDNGTFATSGVVNQDIVKRFLSSHDYLWNPPPLSIAREMFGDHDGQRLIDECLFTNLPEADTLATITRITAQNIVNQYRRLLSHYFPPNQRVDELFICGTSAQNLNIIDFIEAELPETVITKPLDDIGIPGEISEAVCYAHLALETALAQATRDTASTSPLSIDANNARIRGTIIRGQDWNEFSARILDFSQGKQLHVTKNIQFAGNLETAIDGLGIR